VTNDAAEFREADRPVECRPHDVFFKALLLGVVEVSPEFLPVSSTGHLILAADLLGFNDEKSKTFNLAIQTGAMLAVVWEYRAKFLGVAAGLASDRASQRFVANLVVAFIPAAVLGLLFGGLIKAHLFRPVWLLAFIVGAFIILWVGEGRATCGSSVDDMTWRDALKVGFAQCFA
jgi:undecaprenyl-diphosphatase